MSQVTSGRLSRGQIADGIHGVVVILVCLMATIYATVVRDHSNNIWIVYGSSIAYAAGRAGVSVASSLVQGRRVDDPRQTGGIINE